MFLIGWCYIGCYEGRGHVAVNHFVRGSSPCWGAKKFKGLENETSKPFLFVTTVR
jgi:hypothetical protein